MLAMLRNQTGVLLGDAGDADWGRGVWGGLYCRLNEPRPSLLVMLATLSAQFGLWCAPKGSTPGTSTQWRTKTI